MWIKEWFLKKEAAKARRYMTYFDYTENSQSDDGHLVATDGYLDVVIMYIISETEKAIHVVIATGLIVGSMKGWEVWVPKSLIKDQEDL